MSGGEMNTGKKLNGKCLCGACSFTAELANNEAGVCHCAMCRRWSGGAWITTRCAVPIEFAAAAPVGSYKGSEWGERVFCRECGTSLLWQMQDKSVQYVSIQCFDDPGIFDFALEIFHDRKPDCYAFAGERKRMSEAEVFAAAAARAESTNWGKDKGDGA